MDYKYIDQLLDKYWAGETSVPEEQILRIFFSQTHVPTHLRPYQPLFSLAQEAQQMVLGKDFDQRIMAQITHHTAPCVRAQRISLFTRLKPLYKAAAIVAIVLTIGNAAQHSFNQDAQTKQTQDMPYAEYKDTYTDTQTAFEQMTKALKMLNKGANERPLQDTALLHTRDNNTAAPTP